jgi:signal transduction histidine kinase
MFSKIASTLRSTAAWRMSAKTTIAFAVGSAIAFAIMYSMAAREIQQRSDAWLSGEADVLADISLNTPRDALNDRIVEEVAELASREVPGELNSKGQHVNTVFFVLSGRDTPPLFVGPGSRDDFLNALREVQFQPGVPVSLTVTGWTKPFRVVYHPRGSDGGTYLGFADIAAERMLARLTGGFILVWCGMVVLGFVISFGGAYRTLMRVERITETVDHIGSDDLSSRLPVSNSSDEIARLSATFNRMLDRIEASVSQLRLITDSVAHDMKSPVTSIRGSLEVALFDGRDGKWRDSVETAIESLDGLLRMLNTTLDLAEAEAGALRLQKETLSLSDLIQQLADLYHPAMAEHSQELSLQLESQVMVEADVSLLNRAIVNLLDNELTHLPAGSRIAITVRANGNNAEVLIQDNGPGFPTELRDRIFERFVKGAHSKGHGLGLAFVNAVAQSHGGSVSVADLPEGGGAQISLKLPLAPVLAV